MGVSNFTNSNGASGSSGGPGSGTGGPPIMPPPMSQQDDDADVKALLINYNDRFASASPALFRDEVIMQTMSAMVSKKKPNALLIGPAGCGKTAVAEEIARRIASGDQSVPPALRQMTVYELPISSLVAGTSMAGSLEARLKSVIDFARKRSNHAILFIDEIHMVVNDHSTIYSGIAQILKPALARSDLRVIGSTTTQESRALDKDPAFKRRFSRVLVEELTSEQTRVILDSVLTGLLDHYDHKVSVTPDVLDQVVVSADKVMTGHRPDTALTLLDRAMGEVVVSHHGQIHRALAAGDTTRASLLSSLTTIPLTPKRLNQIAVRLVTGQSRPPEMSVEGLEQALSVIKGQGDALGGLVRALHRRSLDLFPRRRPTAWMFAGPSGVGKSETARIISRQVTGEDPIMLNMAEFNHSSSMNRIIGSPLGYVGSESNQEMPFDPLSTNPYRVIVLDEFEKASQAVQRLFLSGLDTGVIETAQGREINLRHAIVIATTNAGAGALSGSRTGFMSQEQESTGPVLSYRQRTSILRNHFDAELLGRFDDLVAFSPLSPGLFREILVSFYERERTRICSENPGLSVHLPSSLSDEDADRMVEACYSPESGARPAERAVRQHIEEIFMS